ncbi:MAG: YeeE/YedE family protein [Aggregatilineales bacterium]
MPATVAGSGAEGGAAPPRAFTISRGQLIRTMIAVLLLAGLSAAAYRLHHTPGRGASASFSLLTGAALGIIFQRGRFCFFCIFRDFIEQRNSGPLFAILTALAAGSIGYAIIFGAFLPNPMSGRLPPDAHIGPVSWVLAAAGLAFGFGMTLSGACISGHLYRLGEGYMRAPVALLGALIGFGLGFFSWFTLYVQAISLAPVAWLPATLGYGGALLAQLVVLAGMGVLLLRWLPPLQAKAGGPLTLDRVWQALFIDRWNPLVTGALVGLVGVFAYFRVEPLGVTAQLGSLSRTFLNDAGLLADRLPGLDTFAGCATMVVQTITDNGFLIGGLALGSLAVALPANRFNPSKLTLRNSVTALLGGILMGWGAMLALGCTVGTLLSGISAFALSGWVFGAAVFIGVWLSLKLRLQS